MEPPGYFVCITEGGFTETEKSPKRVNFDGPLLKGVVKDCRVYPDLIFVGPRFIL